jgi:hypothetical protein
MQIVAYFELSFSPMLDCSGCLLLLLLLLLDRIALGAAVELGGGTILSAIASEALYSLWRTSIHPSGKVRTVHTYIHTKITNIFRKKRKSLTNIDSEGINVYNIVSLYTRLLRSDARCVVAVVCVRAGAGTTIAFG